MSAVQNIQNRLYKIAPPQRYQLYVWFVSLLGIIWVGSALFASQTFVSSLNFWLLLTFVILSQYVSQTLPVNSKSGIIYSISAGSLVIAAIPLFGISAAILMELASMISLMIVESLDNKSWQKQLSRTLFNIGMGTTAVVIAAQAYLWFTNTLETGDWLYQIVIWLIIVALYDQVNLLLVIGVLRLQHGKTIQPFEMWRKNNWASFINVANVIVGGAVLVFAVESFGWLGILAFVMPILSSAFAFRVYVTQTKAQMGNLEKIIAERTYELERLNNEKDDFLAVLTHDMKSPLMSIGMYASMLQQNPHLLQQKPHTIKNIIRAQATLNDLVNNIVDLENLKAGSEMTLDLTPFDLTEMVEFVTESLQPQAGRSKLTLTFKPSPTNIQIVADRLKIERILTNLISNAVKYTGKGGSINVQMRSEEECVHVDVMDTGYGIPAEELPYIFERFRRVKQHRRVALGTGLGLAIAKLIAEAHSGSIAVESEEGVGSTFTLTLPDNTTLL